MIDFFRCWIDQREAYGLLKNPALEFVPDLDSRFEHRGEKTKWKGLEVKRYNSGLITLEGSIHQFHNNGAHNYNDFSLEDLHEAINDIEDFMRIRLMDCQLIRFEFGVNIQTSIEVAKVVKSLFSYGKRMQFRVTNFENGCIAVANLERFKVKVYDKGAQYGQGANLLRFEIHSKSKKHFKKYGIRLFEDLTSPDVHKALKGALIDAIGQILIIDPTAKRPLTGKNAAKFKEYQRRDYWRALFEDKAKFHYHRKNFEGLQIQAGGVLRAELENLISNKWDELTSAALFQDAKKSNEIPQLHKGQPRAKIERIPNSDKVGKRKKNQPQQKTSTQHFSEGKFCRVTGLDISMQKEGSIMLSHEGLKYYYTYEPETFQKVKGRFLSPKWEGETHSTQIAELAHSIRNQLSNMRIKQSRLYNDSQTALFNVECLADITLIHTRIIQPNGHTNHTRE